MKVETTELEYCKLLVHYEADPAVVMAKTDKAIAELKKLPVPGFRPGKAPDHAIRARCRKQIKTYVAREMTAQAYDDVLFETKIKPIGYPKYDKITTDGKETFSCEMTIMKKPSFDLKDVKGLEIPKPHINRDVDSQIEAMLQELRTRFGEIEPYKENDFVDVGDEITMNFNASIDGKGFEGGSAEGILYTVGQNRWKGFDDNLLGMAAGEEREFELTFDDGLPEIGGKTALFKVKVHMGMKKIPCPLDDELAKRVGLETFDDVRQKLGVIVNERIKNTESQLVRQQIGNRIVDDHDFEIPVWLNEMEAQHLAAQSGLDWASLDDKEVFIKQAARNVKLSLILDSVRDAEPESFLAEIEAVQALKHQVAESGTDPEKFVVESQKNGRLFGMIAALRDEFTLQWVADQAKLVE